MKECIYRPRGGLLDAEPRRRSMFPFFRAGALGARGNIFTFGTGFDSRDSISALASLAEEPTQKTLALGRLTCVRIRKC